jgi:hypothetical protein
MTSHINDGKPGSVTTDMTNRNRDLAKRETGAVTAGSGQAARRARPVTSARFGTVVDRVVPAQLACRIGARARAGERDAWPAVVAIALGTFALVFSELIPVGLLADISGHLRVSIGTGGLMVVVPGRHRRGRRAAAGPVLSAAGAACGPRGPERAGPGLRRDRWARAGHRGDARSPRRAWYMRGRVLGVRGRGRDTLVSEQARGTAMAVVSSGIFLATVASLPAGSLIGTLTTWRAAVAVAAVFAVIAVAAQLAAVPHLGAGGRVRPRSLLTVVTRR